MYNAYQVKAIAYKIMSYKFQSFCGVTDVRLTMFEVVSFDKVILVDYGHKAIKPNALLKRLLNRKSHNCLFIEILSF